MENIHIMSFFMGRIRFNRFRLRPINLSRLFGDFLMLGFVPDKPSLDLNIFFIFLFKILVL